MNGTRPIQLMHLAEQQAKFCRVFGNARRVLIYWALTQGELSVGEIATSIGASMQSTSQHLSYMKLQKIIASRRQGQTIYYHIRDNELSEKCYVLERAPQMMLEKLAE